MNNRQARWHNRLNRLYLDSPSEPAEPIILNEAMISQWLKDHRQEYNATETIKACMVNFRLHRRHRQLVWSIFTRIGGY
jgi:hypothetical protein